MKIKKKFYDFYVDFNIIHKYSFHNHCNNYYNYDYVSNKLNHILKEEYIDDLFPNDYLYNYDIILFDN